MSIHIERVAYGGWDDCLRMSDGIIELYATTQVGIRIVHYGFIGATNVFAQVEAEMGKTGGDAWRIYGGHRLWHAPEHPQRTYYPDNVALETTQLNASTVRLLQMNEDPAQLQKQVDIQLLGDSQVKITHRLTNTSAWDVVCAPWALSVMRAGGVAVLPLPPRASHEEELLPNTRLILWAYTDLSDPRWQWGREYILLKQDTHATTPQKIGTMNTAGWLAYVNGECAFIKQFAPAQADVTYADMGVNCELFTNEWMLELESLGALSAIPAGGAVDYVEMWQLQANIPHLLSDADVNTHIVPHLTHS